MIDICAKEWSRGSDAPRPAAEPVVTRVADGHFLTAYNRSKYVRM